MKASMFYNSSHTASRVPAQDMPVMTRVTTLKVAHSVVSPPGIYSSSVVPLSLGTVCPSGAVLPFHHDLVTCYHKPSFSVVRETI
jgi:hypothetical protein